MVVATPKLRSSVGCVSRVSNAKKWQRRDNSGRLLPRNPCKTCCFLSLHSFSSFGLLWANPSANKQQQAGPQHPLATDTLGVCTSDCRPYIGKSWHTLTRYAAAAARDRRDRAKEARTGELIRADHGYEGQSAKLTRRPYPSVAHLVIKTPDRVFLVSLDPCHGATKCSRKRKRSCRPAVRVGGGRVHG